MDCRVKPGNDNEWNSSVDRRYPNADPQGIYAGP